MVERLQIFDLTEELRLVNNVLLRDLLNRSNFLGVFVHRSEHTPKRALSHRLVNVKIIVIEDIVSLLQHEVVLLDDQSPEDALYIDLLSVCFKLLIGEISPLAHRRHVGVSDNIRVQLNYGVLIHLESN